MSDQVVYLGAVASIIAFAVFLSGPSPQAQAMGGQEEPVPYAESFDAYESGTMPPGWWAEGCEQVFVQDGRLLVQADPDEERGPGHACTVWNEKAFSGDVQVEFDAHVVASSIEANNINFFLYYTHPEEGATLSETRQFRLDGGYNKYHSLNGYIFTYVNTRRTEKNEARFRMRRCPGFELIDEKYAYHNHAGETHHIKITKQGNRLSYAVDGTVYLRATDDKYNWTKGLMGFRTFHTDVWIDNVRVTQPGG